MRVKKLLLCIVALMQISVLGAQGTFQMFDKVQLPSVESENLEQIGKVNSNLHTGRVALNIPLYHYKDPDFDLPISLTYSSGGNRPNERSGILGPGWTLNAGGSINIDIKGIPDFGRNYLNIPGFYTQHINTTIVQNIEHLWRYINLSQSSADAGATPPEIIHSPNGPTATVLDKSDAEPDIFNFTLPGHSGTFNLHYNNQVKVYNCKAEDYDIIIDDKYIDNNWSILESITIRTPDGLKYIFDNSTDNNLNRDVVFQPGIGYRKMTSIKLSKIVAPNGRAITFNYTQVPRSSYMPGVSLYNGQIQDPQPARPDSDQFMPFSYAPSAIPYQNQINSSESRVALLQSISIDFGPTIEFGYSLQEPQSSDQYRKTADASIYTFGDCYRLVSVNVKRSLETIKSISMEYATNTNGARNNYLSKVTIPGEGSYTLQYVNWNNANYPYPSNGTLSVDHWGFYNGANNENSATKPFFPETSLSTAQDETLPSSSYRAPSSNHAMCGMIQRVTYPTGGYTEIEYEGHQYSIAITRRSAQGFAPSFISENGIAGGVRVKSLKHYLSNGTLLNSSAYEYALQGCSTGILTYIPRYSVEFAANVTSVNVTESAVYKSTDIFNYGNHIEYASVVEKLNDGGKIKYDYTNSLTSSDYMDMLEVVQTTNEKFLTNMGNIVEWNIGSNFNKTDKIVAPLSDKSAVRGLLLSKNTYKSHSSYTPVKTEEYEYNSNGIAIQTLPCYLIRKFGYYNIYANHYPIISTTITQYSNEDRTGVQESVIYTYNDKGLVSEETTTLSDGTTRKKTYKYVSDLSQSEISSNSAYQKLIDLNMYKTIIEEKEYIIDNSGTHQISGIQTSYAEFYSIPKPSMIKTYNPQTQQWEKEIEFVSYNSKGNITESKDKNNVSTTYIWGWYGLYLVGQIKGISFNEISDIVVTNPLDGQLTSEQYTQLRELQKGEQEFYEYSPFVGISKHISPSGTVTQYYYNSNNKLQSITIAGDQNSNYSYSTDN